MSFLRNFWINHDKYEVEIIIKSSNANYHKRVIMDKPDFKTTINRFEYNVRQEGFFKKPRNPVHHIIDLFRGIRGRYLIIFYEKEPDYVVTPDVTVGPLILERVRTSRILGNALKELFKESLLGGRGIIFIVIVFVAVAIFVLRTMGYIP